jgi:excinuclease ABC subunit C
MSLQKINLSLTSKAILEELSQRQLYLKSPSGKNATVIKTQLEQGKQNSLIYLQRSSQQTRLSMLEENNLFKTVQDLGQKLGIKKIPRRIECYDISHLSGKFVYGSMVVFIDGKPNKKLYKLFKTKEQNNDFANHKETLSRRLNRGLDQIQTGVDKGWGLPDLIIVDGGKGQLSSDIAVLREYHSLFTSKGLEFEPEICAIAKEEELIFVPNNPDPIRLTGDTLALVQRIRDEAHRFAITNNRKARLKTIEKSEIDEIKGVGQKTKIKLLSIFGSVSNLADSLLNNPELVHEAVGPSITQKLKDHFSIKVEKS